MNSWEHSILLLLLTVVSLTWSEPVDSGLPPTGDQCLTEGYFCFEVLKGPQYSYRIRQDDERVFYSLFATRVSGDNGTFASHTWNISLLESIDTGTAGLFFQEPDKDHPVIMLEVSKQQQEDSVSFKMYEWKEDVPVGQDNWKFVVTKMSKDYYRTPVQRDLHSVKFTTTPKVDEMIGLSSKNLTIGFKMSVDQIGGESSTDSFDFGTHDGHYFFDDKPEIREYREKRRQARQQEKAQSTTILIIVLSIIAVIVVSAVVIAICMVSRSQARSQQEKRNRRNEEPSRIFFWKKGAPGGRDAKDPDHSPPGDQPEDEEADKI